MTGRIHGSFISASIALALAAPVRADEIKVIAARVLLPMTTEIARSFEKTSGHTVTFVYDPAGAVARRSAEGETLDVALNQKPSLEKLAAEGKLAAGSVRPIAFSAVSVGLLKGEPKPVIGTVEEFKRTLLAAKSVAYPDPDIGNVSGILFVA